MATDGLSWTFYIRKGIKFHNGDELTANDVKFSVDRYLTKDAHNPDLANMVDRTEVVNDYTVRVYTKDKQPFMPYIMYPPIRGQSMIISKSYVEKNGIDYAEAHPIGTGPFKFVRHVKGDFVQYEALDKHWRQVPAFKQLSVILIPEEATQVALLKTGQLDIIGTSIDSAQELESSGYRSYGMIVNMAVINLHGAYAPQGAGMPLSDIRIRQALSLAINRDEMIKIFFRSKASLPMVPGIFGVSADVDLAYWRDYATKLYHYDPAAATQLLKDAGYPNGFTIKLWTHLQAAYLPKMAEVIQGYWAKIGVNAEITFVDQTVYDAIRNENKTPQVVGQAATYSIGPSSLVGERLRALYHTQGTYGLINKAFPEVEQVINTIMSETDVSKRREVLANTIKTTADTYTQLPIAYVPDMIVLGPKVNIDFPKPIDIRIGYFFDIAQHAK
jgi:peptide/nickel transport system substrate-binding protein